MHAYRFLLKNWVLKLSVSWRSSEDAENSDRGIPPTK